MTAQIPVSVVGGYLGAGKTTLVNHVLRSAQGMRIAVLVNDFGALPIDAGLIEARDGDLISIAGGCICCSFGSDLMGALASLAQRTPRPDQVLIETSGVALPGGVARSAALLDAFAPGRVVVLVDAETVRERAADRFVGDTITRQLDDADIVLINKTDLVGTGTLEELRDWLSAAAPQAAQVEATNAEVSADLLFGPSMQHGRPAGLFSSGAIRPAGDADARYESASFAADLPLQVTNLARALAQCDGGVIRAKGVLEDLDGSLKTLQVVGERWDVTPFSGTDGPTGLACIGVAGRLDRARIERAIALASKA